MQGVGSFGGFTLVSVCIRSYHILLHIAIYDKVSNKARCIVEAVEAAHGTRTDP